MTERLTSRTAAMIGLFLLGAALTVAACADEPAGSATTPVNNTSTNNSPNNNTNNNPNNNPNNNNPGMGRLEHISDQTAMLAANSSLELRVRYVNAAGAPQANTTISWTIIGDSEDTALDARQSVTQGDGVAKASLFSSDMEAFFEVEASVDGDDTVTPIRFSISVQSKQFASYNVIAQYSGVRPFTSNNVAVFLFPADMNCAALDYHRLLGAERTEQRPRDAAGFPMRFMFTNLRNGNGFTAVAVAFADANDKVIGAYGCNDSAPVIEDGDDPDDIIVPMTDILPLLSGRWNITSRFNLSEAVPDNVRQYLDPILNFFVDPAGTIVTLAADFAQEQFGIDIGQFSGLVEDIVDALLDQLIGANQTVSDVFTAAGDVTEILRNFQLQGQITVDPTDVDATSGLVSAAHIEYYTFGYRWRLSCDPGEFEEDPTCGDNYVSFVDADVQPIVADFNGAIAPNPDYNPAQGRVWFHELAIEDHPVEFNYGQIILYLIEKLALPYLFRNLTDENGAPVYIDSIQSLLQHFIGNQCSNLFDSEFFEDICMAVVGQLSDIATDFLREQNLTYERFTFGTPPDASCALYEKADNQYGNPQPPARFHDPQFQLMGKEQMHPQAGDLRCQWSVKIQFSDDPTDLVDLTGTWNGDKAFDQ